MREQLITLINDQYVYPEVAAAITAGLSDLTVDPDPERTATEITTYLQRINHDRHLRVRYRPDGAAETTGDLEQYFADDARRNAGGVQTISRLDDRTGLLTIAPYLSPVHLAEPYITAAFALMADVSRLIIDLRPGRGGTPETVALICGYLLGDEPVHLQDVIDRDGGVQQFWTRPSAHRLGENVEVAVLTSSGTFSGCEELAYDLQALGRATIIGETTGGGAHPCQVVPLTDVLEVTIPTARSRNAVTGSNWEQIGVVPDVSCAADEALDVARARMSA